MSTAYLLLEEHFQKLSRLDHALTFLQWDHMVMMPPGGSEPRAKAIAELTTLRHELLTSPKTGDLLPRLPPTGEIRPRSEVCRKWTANTSGPSVFLPLW